MARKKINIQEQMVNEIIDQICEIMQDNAILNIAAEIVDDVISATEKKEEPQKILANIAKKLRLNKEDVRVEQVFTVITMNPLAQTHFPFQENNKLQALKDSLEKGE